MSARFLGPGPRGNRRVGLLPQSLGSRAGLRSLAIALALLVLLAPALGGCGGVVRGLVPDEYRSPGAPQSVLPPYDVLGPVGAIAVSPFYSLALLSGMAILADRGILPRNEFLRRNRVLKSPIFFAVFLLLAGLISLPRFAKVSNTFGTFLGYLEDKAVLISLVLLNLLAVLDLGGGHAPGIGQIAGASGWVKLGLDVAVAALAVANFFVLRTIRFYFDLLILISPVPLLDGALETAKKVVATVLLALYAYLPAAAAILNLLVFAISCIFFFRVLRATRYYISVLIEPSWQLFKKLLGSRDRPAAVVRRPWRIARAGRGAEVLIPVFPLRKLEGIPAKAALWLAVHRDERGVFAELLRRRFPWRVERLELNSADTRIEFARALFHLEFTVNQPNGTVVVFAFSSMYGFLYDQLVDLLNGVDTGDTGIRRKLRSAAEYIWPGLAARPQGEQS